MTCVNAAGAEDAAAAVNACGSVNVSMKASIFLSAILLAPSKFTLFELLSEEVPTRANSSILHNTHKFQQLVLEKSILFYSPLTLISGKVSRTLTVINHQERKVKFDDQVDLEDCVTLEQEKYKSLLTLVPRHSQRNWSSFAEFKF